MLGLFWASLDFPTFNKDCRKRRGNFLLVIPSQIRNYRRFVKEMNGAVCRKPSLDNVGQIGQLASRSIPGLLNLAHVCFNKSLNEGYPGQD